jgi:hypothetical protein
MPLRFKTSCYLLAGINRISIDLVSGSDYRLPTSVRRFSIDLAKGERVATDCP